MKTKFFICSAILIALLGNVYGQKPEFVLKNKTSGKEKIFHEGKRLKVVCLDGHIYRGRLKLTDTVNKLANNEIEIGKAKVTLDQINVIKPIPLGGKITGSILTGSGSVLTVAGLVLIIASVVHASSPYAYIAALIGLSASGTGVTVVSVGILILISGRNYERAHWGYSILIK